MKKSNELMAYLKGLKRRIFFLFLFFLFISALFSRVSFDSIKTLSPPKIDGVLDDPVWKQAKGYSNFLSLSPHIGQPPKEKTIVYSAYDEDNLYFAFKCFDREPDKIIATVRKRDTIITEDFVEVFIDSHNDSQNAYMFAVNPLGIQMDGIMDVDANSDWSADFVWHSIGAKNAEGYVVEIKIPFQTLRFSEAKVVTMRVAFSRAIPRFTEQYISPEYNPEEGAFVGQLGFIQLEGINYKRIFEFLPSVTYMKRRERDQQDNLVSSVEKRLGLTSKLGITSDLTLDLTLNPDFSHIEIDEGQVDVNLRALPLYEEKRPFFLEGLEHFKFAGLGGNSPIEKIVHTRNIIEPIWGLKLSGKIGKSNIINSLFVVDDSQKTSDPLKVGMETENRYFGILRYKHLYKNDSYVGAIYTGKEYKFYTGEDIAKGYNRVGGLDLRMRLSGSMTMEAFFLYSYNKLYNEDAKRIDNTRGPAFGAKLNYESRKYYATLGYHELSPNFELASGRLIRNGLRIFSTDVERYFYPRADFIKNITLGYSGSLSRDRHYNLNEYSHLFYFNIRLPSNTILGFGYQFATEVFAGNVFEEDGFFISGRSQLTKQLLLTFSYNSGEFPFYLALLQGHLQILSFSVNFEPSRKFSTKFTVQRHLFHEDETKKEIYDVGIYRNKTILQLNKYLSIRGIIEYNTDKKQILADTLVEFTYIPGTVIHLGYGSSFNKEYEVNDRFFFQHDRFRETHSTLFFKASYLFRF
jgi:hypothetical protein